MSKVCAWCNKDKRGRVVCFRCGTFPAPVEHPVSDNFKLKLCARCAVEPEREGSPVTHTICEPCKSRALGGL